ncbi:hypothetical protein [Flindersiella endophytica]
MLPAGYEVHVAKLKTAELARRSHQAQRSKQVNRRKLANALRRLADRIEPNRDKAQRWFRDHRWGLARS